MVEHKDLDIAERDLDFERVADLLERAILRSPQELSLHLRLARSYRRLDDPNRSVPILKRSCEQFPESLELIEALLRQYQEGYYVHRWRVVGEYRLDPLLSSFDARLNHPNPAIGNFRIALAHLFLLDPSESDSANREQAVQHLEQAISLGLESERAHRHLVYLYLLDGNAGRALEEVDRAIGKFPDSRDLRRDRCNVLIDRRNWHEAIKQFEKSKVENPDDGGIRLQVFKSMREILQKSPDPETYCLKHREELLQKAEEARDDHLAWFDVGHAYLTFTLGFTISEAEFEIAENAFKRVIALAPEWPWGYWGMRACFTKQSIATAIHRYDDAIEVTRKAVEVAPDNAQAHFELAEALNENYDQNLKMEALESYKNSILIDPDMVQAIFKIASVHQILSQTEEAAANYRRVIGGGLDVRFTSVAYRCLALIGRSGGDDDPAVTKALA